MTQIQKSRKAVLDRLEIVTAYLSTNMAVTSFTELFNAGGIYRNLFEDTGPVDAEDLDRWAYTCMKIAGEEEEEDMENRKWFLRLFKEYRDLEKRQEQNEAVIASQDRYIEALEGRDQGRLAEIERLEAQNRDTLITANEAPELVIDLRKRPGDTRPNNEEEA